MCSKSDYKLCELCSVNMNATSSLQVGQTKQMPHVISDTGGRNYVWGDIIQLRITTRFNMFVDEWTSANESPVIRSVNTKRKRSHH